MINDHCIFIILCIGWTRVVDNALHKVGMTSFGIVVMYYIFLFKFTEVYFSN
jgi:hypothetical protein